MIIISQLLVKAKHWAHPIKKTALRWAQQASFPKSTPLVGLPLISNKKNQCRKLGLSHYLHFTLCRCHCLTLRLCSFVPKCIVFQIKSNLQVTTFLPPWSITISRSCVLLMIRFSQPVHYCCARFTRGQSQRSEWSVLLKQPYLHPGVHLDRSSA